MESFRRDLPSRSHCVRLLCQLARGPSKLISMMETAQQGSREVSSSFGNPHPPPSLHLPSSLDALPPLPPPTPPLLFTFRPPRRSSYPLRHGRSRQHRRRRARFPRRDRPRSRAPRPTTTLSPSVREHDRALEAQEAPHPLCRDGPHPRRPAVLLDQPTEPVRDLVRGAAGAFSVGRVRLGRVGGAAETLLSAHPGEQQGSRG